MSRQLEYIASANNRDANIDCTIETMCFENNKNLIVAQAKSTKYKAIDQIVKLYKIEYFIYYFYKT